MNATLFVLGVTMAEFADGIFDQAYEVMTRFSAIWGIGLAVGAFTVVLRLVVNVIRSR